MNYFVKRQIRFVLLKFMTVKCLSYQGVCNLLSLHFVSQNLLILLPDLNFFLGHFSFILYFIVNFLEKNNLESFYRDN